MTQSTSITGVCNLFLPTDSKKRARKGGKHTIPSPQVFPVLITVSAEEVIGLVINTARLADCLPLWHILILSNPQYEWLGLAFIELCYTEGSYYADI